MSETSIEWTDRTWNPTTGCDKISEGCDNCYALTMAKRLKAMGSAKYQTDGDPKTSGPGFGVQCHPDELGRPLRWKKPRTVFVNSMSDLFHPKSVAADADGAILDEWGFRSTWLHRVFETMNLAEHHTFQVLTKRPQLMAEWFRQAAAPVGRDEWPLPNVWLGTSIETDRYCFRADHLRDTPAAVRFLSLEPLLGPLPSLDLNGIDWVIVGGESGKDARPMHPDWVRDIRDRCVDAGVPFFFKQWGQWVPPDQFDFTGWDDVAWNDNGSTIGLDGTVKHQGAWSSGKEEGVWSVGKKKAGRELDGRTWDEMPEVSA